MLKDNAYKDPLGKVEELQGCDKAADRLNARSDLGGASKAVNNLFNDNEVLYNSYNKDLFDNNDDEDWAERNNIFNNDKEVFDSDDKRDVEDNIVSDYITAGNSYIDSGYSSDRSDVTITEGEIDYYPMEIEDNSSLF